MTRSCHISTEAYEGPIDLFYDLVVTDRIDPSILSLSGLVESFLSELFQGPPVDLEHLSEFVWVLALLCRLKARRILGSQRALPEEASMESPDRDLWYRLANLTFREAVQELADRLEQRSGLRPREAGPDWSTLASTPELAFSLDSEDLADLARDLMTGARATPDLDHLALDLPTVEEATDRLWSLVGPVGEWSFEKLSDRCVDRIEEAVWFMGLLELARQGRVRISQNAPREDIRIEARAVPAPMMATADG